MHRDTKLAHYGRMGPCGPANPPIVRASTILHDSVAAFKDTKARRETDDTVLSYGRRGTTTAHQLAAAVCDLEDGEASFLFPTGVAALVGAISAYVGSGDHILVVDTIFPATRNYCKNQLERNGVSIDFIPWDTRDLGDWVNANTRAVLVESPASQTFEVMDLPAISKSAHEHGLVVIADNTYGSGWLYRPLQLGCDVSVIAGTKYLGGHADVMMGVATAKGAAVNPLRSFVHTTGQTLGPDDAYACLRGMRTLGLRLDRHGENGFALAKWFLDLPEVVDVIHPALPNHPGREIWERDSNGCNGLFSVIFKKEFNTEAFLAKLNLFSIGTSWGGFESLALPVAPQNGRKYQGNLRDGSMVRFHAGLEHVDDLKSDLFSALVATSES